MARVIGVVTQLNLDIALDINIKRLCRASGQA
jgi:hypothetical protein